MEKVHLQSAVQTARHSSGLFLICCLVYFLNWSIFGKIFWLAAAVQEGASPRVCRGLGLFWREFNYLPALEVGQGSVIRSKNAKAHNVQALNTPQLKVCRHSGARGWLWPELHPTPCENLIIQHQSESLQQHQHLLETLRPGGWRHINEHGVKVTWCS